MKLSVKIVIIVLFVTTATTVPTAFAASPDDLSDENTFAATDNVDVWKDAVFTLRHDFDDAPTTIEAGDYRVGFRNGGEASLNRDSLGVRTTGESVELTYDPSRAQLSDADISDTEVQFIAAEITGNEEPPNTLAGAIDVISQSDDTSAKFEIIEERSLSSGTTTFEHTGGAGHYVYFVVDSEQGAFSISDGSISPPNSGTPTIIGTEQVTFQRGSPAVSAPGDAVSGETLSFNIDATDQFSSTEEVTHTILVHDQSKFSDINQGRFRLQIADESAIDRDLDLSEDANLEHTIQEVNGVASVDDSVRVNGIDISNGRVSRAVSLGQVVDFVAEDINGQTDTTPTGDVRFDASVTAEAQSTPTQTINVETKNDWEPGTYQYVYIATSENNASAVATTTGTISFEDIPSQFDEDGDGQISAEELGQASTQFAQGELTASELGEVATEYALE